MSLTTSQLPIGDLVPHDLRAAVEIVGHDIEPAVVVEVANREPPADARFHQGVAEMRRHFLERPVSAVMVEQLALPVSRRGAELDFVELRIDVTVDDDEVEEAVVVVVEERGPPSDIRQADGCDLRLEGDSR